MFPLNWPKPANIPDLFAEFRNVQWTINAGGRWLGWRFDYFGLDPSPRRREGPVTLAYPTRRAVGERRKKILEYCETDMLRSAAAANDAAATL
jgi:hypothetical protein